MEKTVKAVRQKKMQRSAVTARTNDGIVNLLNDLGLGMPNLQGGLTYIPNNASPDQLDQMYETSWVTGVVVDTIAEDMTQAGIEITGLDDPEQEKEIQSQMTKMGLWDNETDLNRWARLYGGAIEVIDIDGQELKTPLDISTVGKGQFASTCVYDRHEVEVSEQLIETGPERGLPLFYTVYDDPVSKTNPVPVHHSRVIRRIGRKIPRRRAAQNQYWGQSDIIRMRNAIMRFDEATAGASSLVNKAHLRTLQIDGFREIVGFGGEPYENLVKSLIAMRMLQSNEGMSVVDGKDIFNTHSYSFAGLDNILLQFGQHISGASGIPLVRLFGQSPAGLNSTGESDIRNYYDSIHARQEATMRSGMYKKLQIVYRSLFGAPAPTGMEFTFNALWQMSEIDKAAVAEKKTAVVISAYESTLIDQKTGINELKQSSEVTGMFNNISDEQADLPDVPQVPKVEDVTTPEKPTLLQRLFGNG